MGSNLSKIGRLFTPNLLMLWSVLLGIATGLFSVAFLHVTAKIISSLMIDSLKLLSVPIIFFSIVATISSIEEMRSLGTKVLKYTLISTVLAATIALFFFVIIQPVQVVLVDHAVVNGEHTPNYLSTLLDMFPSNIVKAFAENNVMGVVLLAFFLGISSLSIPPEHKQTLNNLFNSFFSVLVKMTQLLIRVLPLGIWAFVTLFTLDMKEGNTAIFHNLLRYIIAVFASTIFQGVVVLPLLLKYKGISPLKVFKGMFSAVSLAFFSKSSSATLPVTMKCACENLKISTRVAQYARQLT